MTMLEEAAFDIRPEADPKPQMSEFLLRVDNIAVDPENANNSWDGCFFAINALQKKVIGVSNNQALEFGAAYLRKLNSLDSKTKRQHNLDSQITLVENNLLESLTNTSVTEKNINSYITGLEGIFSGTNWSSAKIEAAQLVAHNHNRLARLAEDELAVRYNTFLGNPNFYGHLSNFFSGDDGQINWKKYEQNKILLEQVLTGIGITGDVNNFLKAWSFNDERKGGLLRISSKESLSMLAELEKTRPGAAKLLHDFYGLRGFARYPLQMLIDQFDNHGKTDKPY